jgi:hypothetical protein
MIEFLTSPLSAGLGDVLLIQVLVVAVPIWLLM